MGWHTATNLLSSFQSSSFNVVDVCSRAHALLIAEEMKYRVIHSIICRRDRSNAQNSSTDTSTSSLYKQRTFQEAQVYFSPPSHSQKEPMWLIVITDFFLVSRALSYLGLQMWIGIGCSMGSVSIARFFQNRLLTVDIPAVRNTMGVGSIRLTWGCCSILKICMGYHLLNHSSFHARIFHVLYAMIVYLQPSEYIGKRQTR